MEGFMDEKRNGLLSILSDSQKETVRKVIEESQRCVGYG